MARVPVSGNDRQGTPFYHEVVPKELREMLPDSEPFKAYMVHAMQAAPVSPQYHAAVALTLAATELARMGYRLNRQPLMLWTVLVGPPVDGKSSAMKHGLEFMRKLWNGLGVYQETAEPIIQCDESSIPGLLHEFYQHHDYTQHTTPGLFYANEMSRLFGKSEPVWETLVQLMDGNTIVRQLRELQNARKRDKDVPDRIVNPRASAMMATTLPAIAPYFNKSMKVGGFFARFWWVPGQAKREYMAHWLDDIDIEPTRKLADLAWRQWISSLSVLHATDKVLQTTDEAQAILRDEVWNPVLDLRSDEYDENPDDGIRHRAALRTRVLAGLYALLSGRTEILADDMHRAGKLTWRAISDALGAASLVGDDEITRLARRAERMIRKAGKQGLPRHMLSKRLNVRADQRNQVTQTLLDRGVIHQTQSEGAGSETYIHADHYDHLGA